MTTTNTQLSTLDSQPNFHLTTGTWDGARHWLTSGQRCEQLKLFCQVMLGFELIALHKSHGVTHGDNQHDGRISHDGISTWDDIMLKETGLSHSGGYRFMDMARNAAPRLKKIPALKNFDPAAQSIAALPAAIGTALEKAVKKLTDGHTQKEFGEMLGLWKKPSGNPNAKGSGQLAKKLTTEEEARLLREMAMTDSGAMGKSIIASNRNFFLLTEVNDLEVDAQVAVLEHAFKLRRAWLAMPKSKRDPAALEPILKGDPMKSTL